MPEGEKLPALAQALGRNLDELFPRVLPPDLADLRCDAGYSQYQTGPSPEPASGGSGPMAPADLPDTMAVRGGLAGISARGGSEGLPAELLDFIGGVVDGMRPKQAAAHPDDAAAPDNTGGAPPTG